MGGGGGLEYSCPVIMLVIIIWKRGRQRGEREGGGEEESEYSCPVNHASYNYLEERRGGGGN